MAIQKSEAIVLRRQEVRETSLILVAFTRELGKVRGLLKGVRGARAAVPWYLEPLTLQTMVLYERKRSGLALISSCDLLDAFDPIRRDFARLAYAGFALDLVDAMTEIGDPHPELYRLLLGTLKGLSEGIAPRLAARFLEARLLQEIGLLPSAASLPVSAGARLSVQRILQTPPEELGRFRLAGEVEQELRFFFCGLLRNALGRELKSRLFLVSAGLEGPTGRPQPAAGRPSAVAAR